MVAWGSLTNAELGEESGVHTEEVTLPHVRERKLSTDDFVVMDFKICLHLVVWRGTV